MSTRLRVAVASPLPTELADRIVEREPRIELMHEPGLLPPMRHPGDHNGDPAFVRSVAQQRAFEALLADAEALYGIPDERPASLATAATSPRLRWVHTMAAGGGAQVRAAGLTDEQLRRIVVTTSAGVHAEPLAEFALFGLLAGAKTLPRLIAQQRRAEWSGRWTMRLLSEQTVLVIGLGGIGRAVARKLHDLGARVIGTSRTGATVPGVAEVVHPDRMRDVLPRVHAVVVTLPGTAATEHLIDAAFFDALGIGATFVNVGRGSVVDEAALVAALDGGRVGFAALDVFETEPLSADSPLWSHPNVLVSPHTAALNPAEDRLIAELFAENASRLLDGRELVNRMNPVEFY